MNENPPTTWGRGRGSRLRLSHYPAGYPAHVVLGTHRREAVFRNVEYAQVVFAQLVEHRLTCAACLMPDHLHWVLRDCSELTATVRRLKTWTTRLLWPLGRSGKLWQRSFFDSVLRNEAQLRSVCDYIVANPLRSGLVERLEDYPWVYPR